MIPTHTSTRAKSRAQGLFSSLLWCLFFFLLICIVFSDRLQLPAFFKVLGRLHPLVIHFPLVLSLFICFLFFVPRWRVMLLNADNHETIFYLLGLNAFFALVAALFGLFLSREGGYDAASLAWHKWSGIFLAIFSYLFFLFFRRLLVLRPVFFTATCLFPLLAIIVGHAGGNITHGAEYLLEPLGKSKAKAPVDLARRQIYMRQRYSRFSRRNVSPVTAKRKPRAGCCFPVLPDLRRADATARHSN